MDRDPWASGRGQRDERLDVLVAPGFVNTDRFEPGIKDPELRSLSEARKHEVGLLPEDVAAHINDTLESPRHLCLQESVVMPFTNG